MLRFWERKERLLEQIGEVWEKSEGTLALERLFKGRKNGLKVKNRGSDDARGKLIIKEQRSPVKFKHGTD